MKYTPINSGLDGFRSLIGFLAVAIMMCISFTGCSTSKPKPPLAASFPAETMRLHFKRPLIIKTPERDPGTVDEHIRCGLFYFDQERFAEAAAEFQKARRRIKNPWNSLNRRCLMSEAVCHLLTDDKESFVKIVEKLKCTYSSYQLIKIQKQYSRVKVMFDLCDEFVKTGNY